MPNTTITARQCIDFHGYNCTGPSLPEHSRPVVLVLISIFITATILSNLLIISSVAFFRQLQTHTNILALSLAVSDFGIGALVMPLRMVGTVYNCWYYDYSFCNVFYFVDYTLCNSSIFHLSCIAYDRYVAICDPLRYAQRVTDRTLVAMLLISWLGAALFTSPSLLSFSPQLAPSSIEREGCPDDCLFNVDVALHFFYGASPYFITMLVIMAVYARIYHVARRQARQIAASSSSKVQQSGGGDGNEQQRVSNMRREHNATVTLGSIIAVFFLSWLPFFIIVLVFPFVGNFDVEYEVATWMGYISSAVNPLLYASFNRQFRGAFRKILSLTMFRAGARNAKLSE
ncbi:trace amine-associated receptor 4-like [Lethenteron reissneri]|uniref:trace amine-associated receptor 4-like n=1 Tax=Lethenteron reissneri TaxID=7753 RepID=UPI002AB6CEB4|nr:trace amine-associated receptor 4-like [Lethenteron reissneri]